jgi:hypothetical protein
MIMKANKYLWIYKSMHIYTYGLASGSTWNEPKRDDLTLRRGTESLQINTYEDAYHESFYVRYVSFYVTEKCQKKESSNLFTKLYDSNKQKKYDYWNYRNIFSIVLRSKISSKW